MLRMMWQPEADIEADTDAVAHRGLEPSLPSA